MFKLQRKTQIQPADSIPIPKGLDDDNDDGSEPHASALGKRKAEPVRKFRLTKRARNVPYDRAARSAGAVFERVLDEDEVMKEPVPMPKPVPQPVAMEGTGKERKKPRTHPLEKKAIASARESGIEEPVLKLGYEDDEKLMKEMERMVLDYLDDDKYDAMKNLPPTTPAKNDRVGGGVGGGTWADTVMKEDADDGFVYDVYIREEVPKGGAEMEVEEGYGVIVFKEEEDQAWWYEGADEEEEVSDAYASDDEDSNGLISFFISYFGHC